MGAKNPLRTKVRVKVQPSNSIRSLPSCASLFAGGPPNPSLIQRPTVAQHHLHTSVAFTLIRVELTFLVSFFQKFKVFEEERVSPVHPL